MRRGRSSPFSTSASAISEPWAETDTQPSMIGASRPRSRTAWPRASRAGVGGAHPQRRQGRQAGLDRQ